MARQPRRRSGQPERVDFQKGFELSIRAYSRHAFRTVATFDLVQFVSDLLHRLGNGLGDRPRFFDDLVAIDSDSHSIAVVIEVNPPEGDHQDDDYRESEQKSEKRTHDRTETRGIDRRAGCSATSGSGPVRLSLDR
jgi:hypothetical protein